MGPPGGDGSVARSVQLCQDVALAGTPVDGERTGPRRGACGVERLRHDAVDGGNLSGREPTVERPEILVHLRGTTGAGKHHGRAGLRERPPEGEFGERPAAVVREGFQPLDRRATPRELPALEPIDPTPVIPLGKRGGCGVTSGQQTSGEGAIREKPEPSLAAQRQHALLDVAVEQVVGTLISGERAAPEGRGSREEARLA